MARVAACVLMAAALCAVLAGTQTATASGGAFVPPVPSPKPYSFSDRSLYDAWLAKDRERKAAVGAFEAFLKREGVGGVVETWELVRTAADWRRCKGAEAFEVPPEDLWPNIVPTLAFIRDHVTPAIGPLEVVSAYRNGELNACAGGAPRSAHRLFYAVDLAPRDAITREEMIAIICKLQDDHGADFNLGLGFYAETRFHIDSMRLRRWGLGNISATSPCGPLEQAQAGEPAPQQP